MATQYRLPLIPPDALEVNETLSYLESGNQAIYFAAGVPLFVHDKNDAMGRCLASMQVLELKLATKRNLSDAFGIDRVTLYRRQIRLRENGIAGLLREKRGPKGGHKLTKGALLKAQELLDMGETQEAAAEALGVIARTIRRAISSGKLVPVKLSKRVEKKAGGSQPGERSARDANSPLGVATERAVDRMLARVGKLEEAKPEFKASMAVASGGTLLALPALLELGLLDVTEKVYGKLKNGYYGLKSTVLCLALMALLRIRNPERLQFEAPGELGILLGLDRAPEVKTIRRKLKELAERRRASRFSAGLAERWVKQSSRDVGLLYVDGHVRAYHGEKHKLSKTRVARRRLCMPATTDYWVNDKKAAPLFVVTGTANQRLIAAMREHILPEVRRLVGKVRRVTMVFDREGWSPKWFKELYENGFDVLSYRKGNYPMWPRRLFHMVQGQVEGRKVEYELAEKTVRLYRGFKMREVRRMCSGGKQTAVLTTREKMPILQVAWRMFERWRQENFFRYMREHFALDALVDRRAEPAEAERRVPNPKRRKLDKELAKTRAELQGLEGEYGQRAFDNKEMQRSTARGFKIANGELGGRIRELRAQCALLREQRRETPRHVAVSELDDEDILMQLEPETKHLTDTIKMVAYRAETALFNLLGPAYARTEEEGRALVRNILRTPADIVPDEAADVLRVRLHGLANPRSNKAVARLCEQMNEARVRYPGTGLMVRYEALNSAEIPAQCQES